MLNYYTHGGLFHCDEAMGFAITKLARICNEFRRLNNTEAIPTDGLVADIGREYDPQNNKFDHHQGLIQRSSGHPYASAGLLWKKHGNEVVYYTVSSNSSSGISRDQIVKRVDETLIQGIDAHDSDSQYAVTATCIAGKVRVLTVPNIVSSLNSPNVNDPEAQDTQFTKAAFFLETILKTSILAAVEHLQAPNRFEEIAEIKFGVAVLPEGCRWKEHVHEKHPNLVFVISPSLHPGSPFTMVAVPVSPESREVKTLIHRPEWFTGFIHQGQWVAGGNSVDELTKLAQFNINRPKPTTI